MNIELPVECEVVGFFSIEKWKVDAGGIEVAGTRYEPVPPFRNLITNGGLDRMGIAADYLNNCQVGSGSTIPNVNDSNLVSRIAGLYNGTHTVTAQANAPYYAANTTAFQFAVGTATGNISEVGIGWALTGSLFSRALVVDGSGNPTTITVLADEILQVTYQLRYYAPTADQTGTITLNGTVINWVSRASGANQTVYWQPGSSQALGNKVFAGAFDGAIGATVLLGPTGSQAGGGPTTQVDAAYNVGSYSRSGNLVWSLSAANFATGIGALFMIHGCGAYQYGFTPKIMKNNTQTLTLTFSHTWARKAL